MKKAIIASLVLALSVPITTVQASVDLGTLPIQEIAPISVAGQAVTDEVKSVILDGSDECLAVAVAYAADCFRQVLNKAASEISRRPDYNPVSKELKATTRQLNKLVKANLDKSAPTIRVAGKQVRPVKAAAVATVNAQARKIVQESADTADPFFGACEVRSALHADRTGCGFVI